MMKQSVMKVLFGCLAALVPLTALSAEPLHDSVSWIGNSFSGASNKWVQNFFISTKVQPDGTVNTWSHWDEGGKKFGVYKDGDVIGGTTVNPIGLVVDCRQNGESVVFVEDDYKAKILLYR